jgi:hypothetical protein
MGERERMIEEESTTGRKGQLRRCIVPLYIQRVTHMDHVYGHMKEQN